MLYLVSLFFVSCGNSQEVKSITTSELKTILSKDKIQLIDVRTPKEVSQGFIESAMFSDFYNDNFSEVTIKLVAKDKPVYIYCRSGGRSMRASKILQEKGYEVVNILGGYSQWKKEN